MEIAIVGGDDRFACLAALLERRGARVVRCLPGDRGAGALAGAEHIVTHYPPGSGREGSDFQRLLDAAPQDAALWLCGPGTLADPPDGLRIVDLWTDEDLLRENAALTAEGAVAAAMRASRRSLRELPALIVGWGRIGRALTEILVGVGVPTTVLSRSAGHRRQALSRGAEAAEPRAIGEALAGRKLVFNTAPETVLDAGALRRMDSDAMAIDLASPPYGVDLAAAWAMGLRAWREPGLPGRYCPESAAAALLRAMDRAAKREGLTW